MALALGLVARMRISPAFWADAVQEALVGLHDAVLSYDASTGCSLCVQVCPAKDRTTGVKALVMSHQATLVDQERTNFTFFLGLPEADRARVKAGSVGLKAEEFRKAL